MGGLGFMAPIVMGRGVYGGGGFLKNLLNRKSIKSTTIHRLANKVNH